MELKKLLSHSAKVYIIIVLMECACYRCNTVGPYDSELILPGLCHACREKRLAEIQAEQRASLSLDRAMIQPAPISSVDPPAGSPSCPGVPHEKMNTDREWLRRMAEQEDGCMVSVGGLIETLEQSPENPGVAERPEPLDDNGAPHDWRIVGFEPGFRREGDPRFAEEAGTLVWACSLCGSIVRSIASQPPAHRAKNCIPPLPQPLPRRWLSEIFRSMVGDHKVATDKSQRFDRLLSWMDLYQEDGVPIPPHWVSEALEIMTEGPSEVGILVGC